jgi:hypothetical protein
MSHVALVKYQRADQNSFWLQAMSINLQSDFDTLIRTFEKAINQHHPDIWVPENEGDTRWSINIGVAWQGVSGQEYNTAEMHIPASQGASVGRIITLMHDRGWKDHLLVVYSEN